MGAGDTADPPVASEQLGQSKLECAVAQQHGTQPNRLGQRRRCNTGRPIGFFFSRSGVSMETMLVETMHVWNAPGKGLFLRGMCGY